MSLSTPHSFSNRKTSGGRITTWAATKMRVKAQQKAEDGKKSRARKGKGKAVSRCALATMPAELCFHTVSFLTPSGLLRLALA